MKYIGVVLSLVIMFDNSNEYLKQKLLIIRWLLENCIILIMGEERNLYFGISKSY